MQALEPIRWILLACRSMPVLCSLVWKDDATMTSVSRIILANWNVSISKLRRVLAEDTAGGSECPVTMWTGHGSSNQRHSQQTK